MLCHHRKGDWRSVAENEVEEGGRENAVTCLSLSKGIIMKATISFTSSRVLVLEICMCLLSVFSGEPASHKQRLLWHVRDSVTHSQNSACLASHNYLFQLLPLGNKPPHTWWHKAPPFSCAVDSVDQEFGKSTFGDRGKTKLSHIQSYYTVPGTFLGARFHVFL